MVQEDKLLLGKPVADEIKSELITKVAHLKSQGIEPKLTILRVGDKPDDLAYQTGATKVMESLGILVQLVHLPENSPSQEVEDLMVQFNEDKSIHGVLMLRPLPKHMNESKIRNLIDPKKDVDCMSTLALAGVLEPELADKKPCTPQAVIEILKFYNVEMAGKNAVVLGRSTVIGKPVALLLTQENATVTLCHSKTQNLKEICKNADILVAAMGKAKFVDKDFVKPGAVVLDVGINVDENGKLVGDVDMDSVMDMVSKITPVPRGVGSVTTTLLAKNLLG